MKHLEPRATWAYLHTHPDALFVDVRMEIEHLYVGHPPGVVHIPWYDVALNGVRWLLNQCYETNKPVKRKFAASVTWRASVARVANGK